MPPGTCTKAAGSKTQKVISNKFEMGAMFAPGRSVTGGRSATHTTARTQRKEENAKTRIPAKSSTTTNEIILPQEGACLPCGLSHGRAHVSNFLATSWVAFNSPQPSNKEPAGIHMPRGSYFGFSVLGEVVPTQPLKGRHLLNFERGATQDTVFLRMGLFVQT